MITVLCLMLLVAEPAPKAIPAKEALQPFNLMVGPWRGSGYPEGTREERNKGFWTESLACQWVFAGKDVHIAVAIEKGKYYTAFAIRYVPEKEHFHVTATTIEKKEAVFTGKLTIGSQKEPLLTVDRKDGEEDQRLVFTMLHHNRFLYAYHVKPSNAKVYTKKYQVGATKEGEPFAEVAKGQECIVTGGRGTIAVMHDGKTYYVCCSGCKDAFKEEPAKYIAEFEKKNKK